MGCYLSPKLWMYYVNGMLSVVWTLNHEAWTSYRGAQSGESGTEHAASKLKYIPTIAEMHAYGADSFENNRCCVALHFETGNYAVVGAM